MDSSRQPMTMQLMHSEQGNLLNPGGSRPLKPRLTPAVGMTPAVGTDSRGIGRHLQSGRVPGMPSLDIRRL